MIYADCPSRLIPLGTKVLAIAFSPRACLGHTAASNGVVDFKIPASKSPFSRAKARGFLLVARREDRTQKIEMSKSTILEFTAGIYMCTRDDNRDFKCGKN